MALTIEIIGGAGTAEQSANFLNIWSTKFSSAVFQPDPWDIVGAAAGVYTGDLSAWL